MLTGNEVATKDSDGVGLLISILLRYPEVGSVKYSPQNHTLRFTFIFKNIEKSRQFKELLEPALEIYHTLEYRQMTVCSVNCLYEEPYLIVTVTRDVTTLTQSELGLIVELMKRDHPQNLIVEPAELPEDELEFQEEVINHMLANIRSNKLDENVTAVREEGRLLVYSR